MGFCWCALLATAVFAYWPGLAGPFVFDDFATLEALGYNGAVTDWQTFKQFVFGGIASPTGRPVSMLSFLIDANTWPAEPQPFKRSNLVIHLLNGSLLGLLTYRLLVLRAFERKDAIQIAIVCAGIWLLHPLLVSTTLYVVQRMAELSALFVFSGMLAYVKGRSMLQSQPRRAYAIMGGSIIVFTCVGILAKENAVLLPLLVGVVELTIYNGRAASPGVLDRRFSAVFFVLPALSIVSYLVYSAASKDFFVAVAPRDFSLYERLLTQPRVLFDYLYHWAVPGLYTTGVFQDHFIHSKALFSPLSTVLSLSFHVLLISIAVLWRRKQPIVALAVLFFYVAHLMESTTLNLELYFEHRNYLPASFLFLPVAVFVHQKFGGRAFVAASILVLALLTGYTRSSANTWSDFPSMVTASAQNAPTSARAQADYANMLFNAGRYEESVQVLDNAIRNIPSDRPHLLLSQLTILCRLNMLSEAEFNSVSGRLSRTVYDPRLMSIYYEFVSSVTNQGCKAVALPELRNMFVDMLAIEANAERGSIRNTQIRYFIGIIDIYDNNLARGIESFNEVLQAAPAAHTAFNMAKLLASNGYYEEALKFSARARSELSRHRESIAPSTRTSESEIRDFESQVRIDQQRLPDSGGK